MTSTPSPIAADADFIGAGDDVAILRDGRHGILMDVAGDTATIRLRDGQITTAEFAMVAHPDSPAARASIIDEPTVCPACGSDDLGVCCATPEREDHADIVGCEDCDWQAPLSPEGAAALVA